MRRVWVLVCLLIPAAGCIDRSPGGGSPIAGPPKMTVNFGPDNHTEIFVHSSVGEFNYTRLTLSVDNATRGESGFRERLESFALILKVNRTRFHVNVTVSDGHTLYTHESTVAINATASTIRLRSGDEVTRSGLPYGRTLDPWKEVD